MLFQNFQSADTVNDDLIFYAIKSLSGQPAIGINVAELKQNILWKRMYTIWAQPKCDAIKQNESELRRKKRRTNSD